jgi:hypothetical protein
VVQVADAETFFTDGYVALRGAVSRDVADEVRAAAERMRPAPLQEPWWLGLASSEHDVPALKLALTPAVRDAFDGFAGHNRWRVPEHWGFPTRLPGALDPIWHIDGDWFTHHLTSPEQVLTPIFLWQDVGSNDSPTLLSPGSHLTVARLIKKFEPAGIPGSQILSVISQNISVSEVVEATGAAGDVFICHPFLAHTINPASPDRPRVISNIAVQATGALNLDEREGALSPVEAVIASALRV